MTYAPDGDADLGVGTDRSPMFDLVELADSADAASAADGADFGDGERTMVSTGAFELRSRFTGRTAAITQLQTLADKAFDDRTAAFAVVIGEPGMGKTRIISELAARIRTSHPSAVVLTGSADDGLTYGPIARALATRFGVVNGEDPAETRDRIQAGVADVVAAARVPEVAHLIAHLLRVPFDDSPVVTPLLESPQRLEARLFMAVRRLLAAEAERRPVVLVAENLELCGVETINMIGYLAAGLRDQRVAIVGTATPAVYDRHPAMGTGDNVPVRVDLGPLTGGEADELLRQLCHGVELPRRIVDHGRSMGGSPRVIHELVRLLLESNCIVREGIAWRLDDKLAASLALPATYEDLVAARLRVMDSSERRVLEMAAAVGETSWLDAILAAMRASQRSQDSAGDPDGPTLAQIAASGDHSRIAVVAAITKLLERDWLVDVHVSTIAGERELRFASPNMWKLVYRGIDDAARRSYHGTIARWLELHPEGRGPAAQEEVARHLALAGEAREAATRYRRAAEAARAQFANERAIRLFDRALVCIGDSDLAARIHLWHDLGSVYELIGDFEAALGAFERMLRLSWLAASKTKAAVAFNKMGRVWRRKGDLKLALEYLERGLELFRGAGDSRGIAGSLDDIGRALHLVGRYDEAHAKITEALARRGKGGDKRSIATSLSRLGEVQQVRGQYESAYNCHKEALELRRQVGDRWGGVVSQNNLAALAHELGNLADARTGWLAALPEAEAIGALPLAAMILTNLGELSLAEAKQEEARSRLEAALEIIEDVEDRQLESACCRHLAALEKLLGNTAAAQELAERALDLAKKSGLRELEAHAYLTLGDVLSVSLYDAGLESAAIAPAAVSYGRAIEVLKSIGNDAALGKALFAFGRFKAECGELADGKDMLRDAIAVFSKLGLGQPAGDVEKLLATLT